MAFWDPDCVNGLCDGAIVKVSAHLDRAKALEATGLVEPGV